MTNLQRGGVRNIDIPQTFIKHLAEGLIGTLHQYSSVVTFGTAVTTVFEDLINPGFQLGIRELELSFTQRFTERTGGTSNGSISYHWQGREEWHDTSGASGTLRTGTWQGLSGTYEKSIGSGANSEDTLEGYFPVGTQSNAVLHAPVRIRLQAQSLYAAAFTGEVKGNSYVRMVGNVIPGS